jgi:lysophospholipase L1-like esterase
MHTSKLGRSVLFAVLLPCLLFVGCPRDYESYVPNAGIRVACVGNSVTYGFTIANRDERAYPAQLNALLGEDYGVANFGVNNATIVREGSKPYHLEEAYAEALAFQPHIVVISLGGNDTMSLNWEHIDTFVEDYAALITSFAELETAPMIYVCYPTPAFTENPLFSGERIREELLPLIDQVIAETDTRLIDLHTPLRESPELFPDDMHPNDEGAGIIARIVQDAIVGNS